MLSQINQVAEHPAIFYHDVCVIGWLKKELSFNFQLNVQNQTINQILEQVLKQMIKIAELYFIIKSLSTASVIIAHKSDMDTVSKGKTLYITQHHRDSNYDRYAKSRNSPDSSA